MARMAQQGRGIPGARPESLLHPPLSRGAPHGAHGGPLGSSPYPASQAFHPLGDIRSKASGPVPGPRGLHMPSGDPTQGPKAPQGPAHHPEDPPRGPISFTAPPPHPAQAALQPTLANPNQIPSRQLPQQQQQMPRGLPYTSQGPYPAMPGMMHPGTRPFAPPGNPRGMGRGSQPPWGGMGGYPAHPALRSTGALTPEA